MSGYIISCCSTADLPKERFEKNNTSYVCFHFYLDEKEYLDDLGKSVPFPQFYEELRKGAETKTSQVSIGEYCDYFEEFLSRGKDILHVTLSSGLSGSHTSACIAADIMREKYPERDIVIIDSLCASTGYGLFVETLASKRDEGMPLLELAEWAENNKLRLQHWFFSTDLKWYVKGGRISSTAGFIGNILGICPILHMDAKGQLVPIGKVRTKKKAYRAMLDAMKSCAENGTEYSGKSFLCHSDCPEDAKATAELIEEHFPKLDGKVFISDVGTVIGSHTGPGTVALFFWGEERE